MGLQMFSKTYIQKSPCVMIKSQDINFLQVNYHHQKSYMCMLPVFLQYMVLSCQLILPGVMWILEHIQSVLQIFMLIKRLGLSVGGNNFLNCETAVQAVAQSLENSKGLGRIREDVVQIQNMFKWSCLFRFCRKTTL